MCGIAGAIGPRLPDPDRIARTLDLMRNRGPDARGAHCESMGDVRVALLFTRLAIIDLDPRSNQPFIDDDAVLVFNGEIYNHVEVRRELEAEGCVFRTKSDTEVLLKAWRRWGEDAFDRLEGMWAFALLDRRAGRVILSRDRFGEKPLYLWRRGETLYFGSEVKFLAALAGEKPEPDTEQIRRFLVNGYRSLYKRPRTWFKGIEEFPKSAFAELRNGVDLRPRAYWRLEHRPNAAMTAEEALEGARERLTEAMRLRLRADTPIALCLSGGVDSTVLAGLAVKTLGCDIHTFSIIDTDERYDERDKIELTTAFLGCPNHKVHTASDGFFDRLAAQTAYHDGPVATISYYMHAFLSEAMSTAGFRVAISGTGADELFTGYYDHYGYWLAEMSGRPDFPRLLEDWRNGYGTFVVNPLLRDPLTFLRNPQERGHMTLDAALFSSFLVEPFDEPFEETRFCPGLLRNRMLNELFIDSTPIILREDDMNSMRWSVENRSPYLDRRLAEFMFRTPSEHLIRDGYPKYLLRAAGRGVAHDAVLTEKRKRGFNASIDSLIDRKDPAARARLLDDGPIFDLVRRDAVENFINGSLTDNSFSKFLFSFVASKLFLEDQAARAG
jgi:asparagine synthase (glutamine-hydrolysing)